VPDPAHETVRDLVRARESAGDDLRRKRQQLLSFLLRHSRIYSGGGHWTLAHVNGAAIFLKSGGAKFPSLAGCGDQPLT